MSQNKEVEAKPIEIEGKSNFNLIFIQTNIDIKFQEKAEESKEISED